ncbi:MAG: hypothetical protein CVU62_02770 [Deltaproteobacteria bacterium HGW-Deltaproteobacteria-2]|jgi:hypothetical protein|nr:MAG: hypothetical protein CVU62_02770 [Deltaproteobacteria bacterium HGW-Deltaproteobacteria-2]
MKKLWLVLLSLGLIMAFSVSAFAVDVKVSAEYFAGGLYLNKTQVFTNPDGADADTSTAFFYQRLRMGTDFIVSPCLKLVTRFDAMERIWGGARSNPGSGGDYYGYSYGGGTRAEGENISIDLVYIDYTSPIGQFKVGYQQDWVWGTVFDNWGEGATVGQIQYWKNFGPLTLLGIYAKETDNSFSAITSSSTTDLDYDSYRMGAIYNFKGNNVAGETGILLSYDRDATNRANFKPTHKSNIYMIAPYVKTKIGPVTLQAELEYAWGDAMKLEDGNTDPNVSLSELGVFLDASANFGIFNVGGSAAYISGDDPGTQDKVEGGYYVTGGLDWNPCLILFNNDLRFWAGWIPGHVDSYVNDIMYNAWFFQGRVGVKPTPQLDVLLSASYAFADKKPDTLNTGYSFANGTYGTEIDLVGNYKITNNLSYMLGVGYLFTGDLFKGYDDLPWEMSIQDNFILINKLTLTF